MRITDMFSNKFIPFSTLVLYENDSSSYYVELHRIENGKMLAGKPLSEDTVSELKSIFNTIKGKNKEKKKNTISINGVIPKNLLYLYSDEKYTKAIWYETPKKHYMFFKDSSGIDNGTINAPGILFMVERETLYVYAFKGNKPKKDLYHLPFFNVYSGNHSVCLGNTKSNIQLNDINSFIAYYRDIWWNSNFSADLDGSALIEGGTKNLMKYLLKGNPFPYDKLIKIKTTLKDLL